MEIPVFTRGPGPRAARVPAVRHGIRATLAPPTGGAEAGAETRAIPARLYPLGSFNKRPRD